MLGRTVTVFGLLFSLSTIATATTLCTGEDKAPTLTEIRAALKADPYYAKMEYENLVRALTILQWDLTTPIQLIKNPSDLERFKEAQQEANIRGDFTSTYAALDALKDIENYLKRTEGPYFMSERFLKKELCAVPAEHPYAELFKYFLSRTN